MQKPRPYILAETNWKTVKETDYQVAVLPWGATEAHNYHLPYATDNIQADYVAAAAAHHAWEAGAKVLVLPCIPFGPNTGQLDIKFCMNLNPSTQLEILKDVMHVLSCHDIQKFVIFNGHGGNNFKSMIRELAGIFPEIFTCALNWFQAVDWNLYFDDPGDHAGEMETSAIMHIAPELVLPLSEAGDGSAKNYKIQGLRDGWVTAQRAWTQVTKDTGVGNPYPSTPEKGKKYIEACAQNIGQFFTDLAQADLNEFYS